MKKISESDIDFTKKRYSERLKEFGYSPKTLGWTQNKQEIRFDILTSLYDFENKSVLDIGCGFGDLNKTISKKVQNYSYLGVDICEDLIETGKEQFFAENIEYSTGDFLQLEISKKIDWAIESGIFNLKLNDVDNYDFIKAVMAKTFSLVGDGFSFDFISDKVDYKDDYIFYANPEKILSFAYELSRNVVLRSDYMPFEFTIFVFKDDSFEKGNTIFNRYKNARNI